MAYTNLVGVEHGNSMHVFFVLVRNIWGGGGGNMHPWLVAAVLKTL